MASAAGDLSDYSLLDPLVQDDPFAMYEAMQAAPGIYQMPETGFFIISRYADLRAVLADSDTFSNEVDRGSLQGAEMSERHQAYIEAHGGYRHIPTLQRADAPLHQRHRRLVDKVFTPARVRNLVPHIEQVADRLIDRFAGRGACDYVAEYTLLLPGIILAEQMGLDASQVATFKRWADAMLAPASTRMAEDVLYATADIELEAQRHLDRIFEEKREHPDDGIISGLVHAHKGEGEAPLTSIELQAIMSQLIGGGFESTMTAMGHALLRLINNPDQMALLRERPDLITNFVNEVLRINSPTQGLRRRATRDVVLNGTLIPKDAVVIVRYGAANRDPAKFACPHMFDMTRANAGQHLTFGMGAHFCVGAVLAKQEIATGTLAVLGRLDNIRLARPLATPLHDTNFLTLALRELPICFTRRE